MLLNNVLIDDKNIKMAIKTVLIADIKLNSIKFEYL